MGFSARMRKLTPVRLPPGRARLATKPCSTGSRAGDEDDWDRRRCGFGRACRRVGACHDHIDFTGNKVGDQSRYSIKATFLPRVFYCQVLSLDIAGFAQSLAECGYIRIRSGCAGRSDTEEADHRHCFRLRPCDDRPSSHSTAEENKVPSPHDFKSVLEAPNFSQKHYQNSVYSDATS